MVDVRVRINRDGTLTVVGSKGSALIQDSQDIEAALDYTTMTEEERQDLFAGWNMAAQMDEALVEVLGIS